MQGRWKDAAELHDQAETLIRAHVTMTSTGGDASVSVLDTATLTITATNLAGTNWINLLSVTNLSASPYQFQDPAGAGQPTRFYRAFMQ